MSADVDLRAVDLFAGTGWGVACQALGIDEAGVEIMPEAVATRTAAGMRTWINDVWDVLLTAPRDSPEFKAALLLSSPPCQTFSRAGKGEGRAALDEVLKAIALREFEDPSKLREFGARHDPRTALVLSPLAYVWEHRPLFVVFEQVPPVLPVWEACAAVMRELGYSAWTGTLNAEQYGVPQTRTRAFLIARRDGVEALPPEPTHSRYYSRQPHRLDIGVLPWVSMAEALGWSEADLVGFPRRADTDDVVSIEGRDYRARDLREAEYPAQVVTEKARSWQRFEQWTFAGAGKTSADTSGQRPRLVNEPAHTITGAGSATFVGSGASRVTVNEAAVLQSYPSGFPWKGSQTRQYLQVGNAVPPKLAEAILRTFIEEEK